MSAVLATVPPPTTRPADWNNAGGDGVYVNGANWNPAIAGAPANANNEFLTINNGGTASIRPGDAAEGAFVNVGLRPGDTGTLLITGGTLSTGELRVGGRETITTDVRVIAATNRKLDELVAADKFRSDLLYRLNGVTITLPPLRERKEDITLLAEHFIRLCNRKLEKNVTSIAPDALRLLDAHDWPGNVRELQNVIRYAVIQAIGDVLTAECLPASIRGGTAAPVGSAKTSDSDNSRGRQSVRRRPRPTRPGHWLHQRSASRPCRPGRPRT